MNELLMSKIFKNKQIVSGILKNYIDENLIVLILDKYQEMISRFLIKDYSGVLVSLGKFVEAFFQALDFLVRGTTASKPDQDKILQRLDAAVSTNKIPSSLRNLLAENLRQAFKLRNSRDGAHLTDFIANRIDSQIGIHLAQWCLAELVRIYSKLSMEESFKITEEILEFPTHNIQKFGNEILVLKDLSCSEEILTQLLYAEGNMMPVQRLKEMIKLQTPNNITTSLRNCEKKRYIYRSNSDCYLTENGKRYIIEILNKE